jgi:hypothetical protein
MSTTLPTQATLEKLIALGEPSKDNVAELLGALIGEPFVQAIDAQQSFAWLNGQSWLNGCAVVRGIVRLEEAGLTKSCGSVSAVNSAYRVMERRDPIASMELAAWIVDHSDNAYIPFPMCKIRYAFESIKRTAGSWSQCRWTAGATTNGGANAASPKR